MESNMSKENSQVSVPNDPTISGRSSQDSSSATNATSAKRSSSQPSTVSEAQAKAAARALTDSIENAFRHDHAEVLFELPKSGAFQILRKWAEQ